jgi:hypothetical protein
MIQLQLIKYNFFYFSLLGLCFFDKINGGKQLQNVENRYRYNQFKSRKNCIRMLTFNLQFNSHLYKYSIIEKIFAPHRKYPFRNIPF